YVGVDYAATMVAACQKRFPSASQALQFAVCDARDMSQFSDDSFDLILFSFNGIDYSSHGDRFKIFQEVSRVGKSGGYFCFSSHNLQAMEREFNWRTQMSLNPVVTYTNLMMLALLRLFNRSLTLTQLQTSTHATLVDESHNFQLETYYIRPQAQVNQLQSNFDHIRVFSWTSGLEITEENQWRSNTDMWLYYLCTIK
ncbi:MAG: class I SAM-dependent methyltransferase, partial [Leptolyngbyaceae cyanobacterium SL_7_1]|nr:class I SAM-dependent methyltransferase [Leptolyngbyaceae cyanobacterium SL_7_1]